MSVWLLMQSEYCLYAEKEQGSYHAGERVLFSFSMFWLLFNVTVNHFRPRGALAS